MTIRKGGSYFTKGPAMCQREMWIKISAEPGLKERCIYMLGNGKLYE